MTDAAAIAEGDRLHRASTRTRAKTFHFASLCLPRECRVHAFRVYGFCRWVDDLVDDEPDPVLAAAKLDHAREALAEVYDGRPASPALLAFRETVVARSIPRGHFLDLLAGMEMDLVKNRYENFEELELYCHRVAGVVGLTMARVFGFRDDRCLGPARSLGIAMQLTNILRDVKEDHERGRIYLPRDERAAFGLDDDAIAAGRVDEPFRRFMRIQIARARGYYAEARHGVDDLHGATNRLCVRLMARLYGGILDAIERNGHDVYSSRARVSPRRKLAVLAAAQPRFVAEAAAGVLSRSSPHAATPSRP